jgi:uncharacterized protein (TIGR02246 family)
MTDRPRFEETPMNRHRLVLVLGAVAVLAVAVGGVRIPSPAVVETAARPPGPGDDAAAGIRKNADEYTKAFNAGDAKAAAMSWTAEGEYTDPDGETHRGRAAVEQEIAAFLKARPKAALEVTIESVRPLGKHAATAEGTTKVRTPVDPEPAVARFSGVFVREDDGWKIASLQNWVPDPATDVTVKDLAWLVGEWTAKGDGGELRITYAWDENQVFLNAKYTLTKDGKAVSSGTQVIGTNPEGGLRSWLFDGSGATGDSVWTRDGNRWLIEATGTLPDGTEMTAANVLIPLGPDAFTWQSTQRTVAGTELPDQPPIKVTRVKK